MVKILWISKRQPYKKQVECLEEMFGKDVKVVYDHKSYGGTQDIINRYQKDDYNYMVILAPLSIIKSLSDHGIQLLWSEFVPEEDPFECDYQDSRGKGHRFVCFKRIKRVVIEFEE